MANAQGPFACESIIAVADGLGVPRLKVLSVAGFLEDLEVLPEFYDWSARLTALPDPDRQNTLALMESVLRTMEGAVGSRQPR
jgi:hypothetical protein